MAKGCRSFILVAISNRDDDEVGGYDSDSLSAGSSTTELDPEDDPDNLVLSAELFADLRIILNAIGLHGNLKNFTWRWKTERSLDDLTGHVPPDVWRALSPSANNLENLEVSILMEETKTWSALTSISFPNLRSLRLHICYGVLGPHPRFQSFLKRLPLLELLDVEIPDYWFLTGFKLRSVHPRLKSLKITTRSENYEFFKFLQRHTLLERLSFPKGQLFIIKNNDLPNLKALSITFRESCRHPGLMGPKAKRSLKHLRVTDLSWVSLVEYKPLLSSLLSMSILSSTLRCLELDFPTADLLRHWMSDYPSLSATLPTLEEFGILATSERHPYAEPINSDDLVAFLRILDNHTTLIAVRFCDCRKAGSPLPSELLADLGSVPAPLRYLQWDVDHDHDPKTYLIERQGTRTVAIPMKRPPFVREQVDWTSESILDHLSSD